MRKCKEFNMPEFWKSLVIAILAPIAVSSFTFASRYGGFESTQANMLQKQEVILNEVKALGDRVNDMRVVLGTQVDGMSRLDKKTDGVESKVETISSQVSALSVNITKNQANAEFMKQEIDGQRNTIDNVKETMAILKSHYNTKSK